MATLSEQIGLLNEQLQLSQQADNARHFLEQYDLIRTPLFNGNNSLETVYNRYLVLQYLPEDAPQKMEFSDEVRGTAKLALSALQTFTDRWQSEGHEARQGNDLSSATNSLNGLVTTAITEVDQCWKSWRESLENFVALDDTLLESQRHVFEEIYKAFVKDREDFRKFVAKFPKDVMDIKKLQQISDSLQQLKAKMQFDYPKEVAEFYKQLESLTHKVSLSAMTPEVFEWLRSRDLLDAYVVSRKGNIYGY